jgi:hypothetical protein
MLKRKPIIIALGLALVCAGCASRQIVNLSGNLYMITEQSAAGAFANLPKMKAEVVQEATHFAAARGKEAEFVSIHDTFPAHGFPSVEYQFRLVDKPSETQTNTTTAVR